MNEGKIEIEGIYETKDLWRSAVNHYFNLSSIYYFFWAFVLYGFFLTFLFLRKEAYFSHFVDVVLTAIVFIILYGLAMSYLSLAYTKQMNPEKYKFTFSNDKTAIVTESFASYVNWDWFLQIKETKKYFILSSKIGQKTLLPKRFFRDYEQLVEFKKLISAKLGERARLKKSKETLGLK